MGVAQKDVCVPNVSRNAPSESNEIYEEQYFGYRVSINREKCV